MFSYMIDEIDLKDFMVVKKEFFAKEKVPFLTLGTSFLSMNRDCHTMLERCEYVQFRVAMEKKGIIIAPISSSGESAVAWKGTGVNAKHTKLYCPQLALQLYKEWGLKPEFQYKMRGELITPERKIMLHFSLYDADVYDGIRKVEHYCPEPLS